MARLTHPRVNGIKTGYWSPAKMDELIEKLGPIEEQLPDQLNRLCDYICKYGPSKDPAPCDRCPLNIIDHLID
ncbi:MAG: hypothetical protein IJD21_03130 [Oscillospiraceae bacterium]|nr:hypothetical protein [Oscillospiraceae bacterium]